MRSVQFVVHMDVGDNDVVWWAESPDIPGLSVAADTLVDLRRLVSESASIHANPAAEVTFQLTGLATPHSGTMPVEAGEDRPTTLPASHAAGSVGFVVQSAA